MSADVLTFVLLAIGLVGSADFFGGLASRRTNPFTVAAVSQWVGVPFIAVVALVVGSEFIARDVAFGAVAGVGSATGVLAMYRGFSLGSVGIVAPVAATVAAIVPIVVGLVGGERPSTLVAVGLVLGVGSVILVGYVPGKGSLSMTSVIHGVAAGIGFGGMVIAYAATSEASGLAPAFSGRVAAATVASIAVLAMGASHRVPSNAVLGTFLAGALAGIGMGFFVSASQRGELVVVGMAVALFPAVTVVLARLFLDDHLAATQWVGLVGAVGAVAMISIG
ncbi:MAG: DMT family transporter [Acidimicrobiia bacterium]|nr:DMT family transporter [Acidimicrobiia bacterium]